MALTPKDSGNTEELETVGGVIKSVVYRNEENGYTVLHVEPPSEFELARAREITIVGKTQAAWEGEEVSAKGRWVSDKVHGRQFKADEIVCVAPKSLVGICLLYTSPSPRDRSVSRMPSSA